MVFFYCQLITMVAMATLTAGFFFTPTSLGGQAQQGDRQWQEFDKYVGNSYEDGYSYQNPYQQQYIDYQHHSYQQPAEILKPSQALLQATQHLLHPAGQQHLFQIPQPSQQQQQQTYTQPAEHVFHSPLQLLPSYHFVNRFPSSQPAPHNHLPFVLRLVENQSLLPVKAVYSLPPFLEKLVQRVQGYYSVYNTPEQLTLDRPLFRPTDATLTTNFINTGVTESNDVDDSGSSFSTAFPALQHTGTSTTESPQIKTSTKTPETPTTKPTKEIPSSTTTMSTNKQSTETNKTSTESTPTTTEQEQQTTKSSEDITEVENEKEPTTETSSSTTTETSETTSS